MKALAVVTAMILGMFAAQSYAGTIIPYPKTSVGTVAPTDTYTAVNGGDINVYFYNFNAYDTDAVEVLDITPGNHATSAGPVLYNHASGTNPAATLGEEVTALTGVTAGDQLEIEIFNTTNGYTLSSVPSDSADGYNHAYAAPWTGGVIPGSTTNVDAVVDGVPVLFVGMEDLYYNPLVAPGTDGNSDLDYNDDQFLMTNIQDDPPVNTPEPSSLYLLGTGLLGLAGLVHRKLHA